MSRPCEQFQRRTSYDGNAGHRNMPLSGRFLYGLARAENLVHGGHGDDEAVRQHNPDALFPNDPVLIRRVNGVVNSFVGFEQLDDRGKNVTLRFNSLEGKDERQAGLSPIDAPGEQVTKLAVSEFLNATVGAEA
jgi:hypothetical protein